MFSVLPLTHVLGDDGEGLQVGFPDVLSKSFGVVLEVAEQMRGAALGPLDLLPVLLVFRIQYGTASSHQILENKQIKNNMNEGRSHQHLTD